ncbi:hypothetical protein [Azospirillum sp. INR13]|uniref:hypothetical protein n=1 Tax=Azospirillum sp. INR13 TaxID=2596919 RepID=UPI00351BED83
MPCDEHRRCGPASGRHQRAHLSLLSFEDGVVLRRPPRGDEAQLRRRHPGDEGAGAGGAAPRRHVPPARPLDDGESRPRGGGGPGRGDAPLRRHDARAAPHAGRADDVRNDFESLFKRVAYEGVEDGSIRTSDVSVAVKVALGAINWLSIWYRPRPAETRDDREILADKIVDSIMQGLNAPD